MPYIEEMKKSWVMIWYSTAQVCTFLNLISNTFNSVNTDTITVFSKREARCWSLLFPYEGVLLLCAKSLNGNPHLSLPKHLFRRLSRITVIFIECVRVTLVRDFPAQNATRERCVAHAPETVVAIRPILAWKKLDLLELLEISLKKSRI